MLIAITGSSGFIGKHLVNHIIRLGHDVRLIQRKRAPNAFHIEDISTFNNWAKALSGVDVVIHCASKVHCFNKSLKNNYDDFEKINVLATQRIALHAAKNNVKRLIFLSSVKVNGEKTKKGYPFRNNSGSFPKDFYAKSKFKAEETLKVISKKENLEIVIIRPPLVYGPNVRANFFKLLEFVYRGIPLPLMSINNKRSIMYVENLVEFIIVCLDKKSAINKTFLVSDSLPISTPDLIKLIYKCFVKESRLFHFPVFIIFLIGLLTRTNKKFEKLIDSMEIDPKETFEIMNWVPPYSTYEGIKSTVMWFKNKKIIEKSL